MTATKLFKRVEIEINTGCNRTCPNCVNSVLTNQKKPNFVRKKQWDKYLKNKQNPKFIKNKLYKKIINELVELGFAGRISYHFFSEPLLHPDITTLIEFSHEKLPGCEQLLYTNGDLLDGPKYDLLIKAGVDRIVITNYDERLIPEREKQTIRSVKDLTLTNRGGILSVIKKPLSQPCYSPSERLMIDCEGNVLLCYEDAFGVQNIGNIKQKPIFKIWYSKKYDNLRIILKKGKRYKVTPCKFCDNQAHIIKNQSSLINISTV